MPVVHTRSHQQAAGMKYAAGAGDVDKHGCDDSSKIVHHIVPQGKFLHSWPEWRRIPFTSDALGQVLKGQCYCRDREFRSLLHRDCGYSDGKSPVARPLPGRDVVMLWLFVEVSGVDDGRHRVFAVSRRNSHIPAGDRPEQFQGLVRGEPRTLRGRLCRAGAAFRRDGRAKARGRFAERALRAESERFDCPHQSRHPLLQGQAALQGSSRYLVLARRQEGLGPAGLLSAHRA
jgi:hypothetical protein